MQALTIPPVPADLNGLKVLNGHLVSDWLIDWLIDWLLVLAGSSLLCFLF
jgi:hypothetical protein